MMGTSGGEKSGTLLWLVVAGLVAAGLVGWWLVGTHSEAEKEIEQIAQKITFCDKLRTRIGKQQDPAFGMLLSPRTMLSCLHESGEYISSDVTLGVTSCQNVRNWSIRQTARITWKGKSGVMELVGKDPYKTGIVMEIRAIDGYVSTKSTLEYDEAIVKANEDCADGRWIQSDERWDSETEDDILRRVSSGS